MQLETLETRNLLAVGPELIGIQPNLGDLLKNTSLGDNQYDLADVGKISVLAEAPRELRLSFDESQAFATSNVRGIQVTRAGTDGILATADDVSMVRSDLTGFTGFIGGDTSPNRNVVVLRFPETLPDDLYRVEIFGVDLPGQNIVGLRNTTGDLFIPSDATASSQKIDFKLSLGAQITAVVPQPVERLANGTLKQQNNLIDVYFNDDKLFPSAVSTGQLTPNPSVVRPEFYQLILTQGTVRNTDDLVFNPLSVAYNPATNSARLTFASNLNQLIDPNTSQPIGYGTFRLRVGTNELTPTNTHPETPTHVSPTSRTSTNFGTAGAVVMDFVAVNDFGEAPRIDFLVGSLGAGVLPTVQVNGQQITVTLNASGPTPSTAADVRNAINGNMLSAAIVTASIDPITGGSPLTVLGIAGKTYDSVQLLGLGSSFDTATDIGNLALANSQNQLVSEGILDSQAFPLDFPSTKNEPGHRDLPDGAGNGYEQHILPSFGYDTQAGPRTIYYNFRPNYGIDPQGNQLTNDILATQKQRVREALELWANYIGVQFVEHPTQGVTFATGDTLALNTAAPDVRTGTNSVVRVDPTFTGSTIILSKTATWNDTFGQSYFQEVMRDVGWVLGLGNSPELPASNELVFPNDQDVIHGQLLHHPDSNDIDLYRFTIDLAEGKTGSFTAQTFAERQADSSLLDSVLRLYRQTDSQAASVSTDFNSGELVRVRFTAATADRRGNDLTISFTQSNAIGATTQIVVVGSAINITLGVGQTANDLMAAIAGDADASQLVNVTKESGDEFTVLSTIPINYSPLGLSGGVDQSRELIASNDDYFSKDSLIRLNLGRGTYFIGVSAKGNENYDPSIESTGFGGRTSGKYDLQLNFRPQVDSNDTIRDQDQASEGLAGTPLDGDGDGAPGGVYNFWFQTQNLNRVLEFTGGGAAVTDGQIVTITNHQGVVRRFEFNSAGGVGTGNVPVPFAGGDLASTLATNLATAINGATGFNSMGFAMASGGRVTLTGDRLVSLSASLTAIKVHGKTIFVDKAAGPNADGSESRPFNNISSSTVANAFAATYPGDIVRIVGNGGTDGNLATVNDTFAYEIGYGTLPGQILSDGTTMEVPKGVTVMVDAGAVFKLRSARIGVGSSSLGVDRSQSALQVLGTPLQSVFFTSWLDETIGRDSFPSNTTTPGKGNWGGISFRSDLDHAKGQFDVESQGVFLNYVNHADIRYGGGIVSVDSVGQVIQPIQMTESRPTVTFNTIRNSADSAMSADPDSFAESDFSDPLYQLSGEFTPDYDRVGPEVHGNRLVNNSINGLFVRIATAAGTSTKILSKTGRFDDTDIVHYLAENLEIRGTPGGPIQEIAGPSVNLVSLAPLVAGALPAGTYTYRLTFVDANGYESPASDPTNSAMLAGTGAIRLNNVPAASGDFVSRRLYRSNDNMNYKLVATLNAADQVYVDDNTNRTYLNLDPGAPTLGTPPQLARPRLDASLVVDPGTVIKLEGARFETTFGAQFTAEGLVGQEIIFTSNSDDKFGAGGTFDTNNDDASGAAERAPAAGDWGGVYLGHTSGGSIDHALLAYGGGVTKIEGTFTGFNVLEAHQARLRLAHSSVENNASGMGGQAAADRLGRTSHVASSIFVRGAQPVILENKIRDNASPVVQIDVNSLHGQLHADPGRQTGDIDRQAAYDQNRGPLVRDNRLSNNGTNGMVIRTGTLAVEGVWDDTDIAHVLFGTVTIPNFHTYGGLRLESSPTESLVVKFGGGGLTATGTPLDIDDRIGGMLHIVGQPGYPVVLTSINDDTIGAGVQPDGTPMLNTNNSAAPTIGRAGEWSGLLLDRYSHDRNVEIVMETELADATAPGTNATPDTAQVLGDLAANLSAGDNSLRIGFTVHSYLNDIHDVDVYSFTAEAGTEVWLDLDRTAQSLDSMLELLNADGLVLARSNDSTAEAADPSLLYVDGSVPRHQVNPLPVLDADQDFWTLNPHDAGLRVVLPGTPGARSTFFFRVRSNGPNLDLLDDGLTAGAYDVQLRMRATDEQPGSTVRFADVRYAVNGVRLLGLPAHSPLTGEIAEDEETGGPDNNNVFAQDTNVPGIRPQDIGNLLASDRGTLSIAGSLSSAFDLDVFAMKHDYQSVGASINNPRLTVPTVFDIDYADGLIRPDTTISVFDPDGRLILIGRDSNIADDQPRPLSDTDMSDLGRGSAGQYDAFIGPVSLPLLPPLPFPAPTQQYFTVVSHGGRIPDELVSNPLVRLEPIDSVARIAEDHIGSSGGSTAFPPLVPQLLDPAFVGLGPNLWHVTNRRANDAGHGLTQAFDGSRVAGAGVVTEQEPNNSLLPLQAQNLDTAQWSIVFDANVGSTTVNTSASIPHVRVNATGNGTFDYYSFTVSAIGFRGFFDIDGGATGQPGTIDTQIFLYDTAGNLLASNDNAAITTGSGGSTSSLDAFLEYTFTSAGTYVLAVAESGSTGAPGGVTGNPPDSGDQYTLNVSIEGHAIPPINTNGGQSFYFGREASGNYDIGGQAVGSLLSAPFDLGGYSAADLPRLYFNYFLQTDANTDRFRVWARDSAGAETLLASSLAADLLGGNVTQLTNGGGIWRQTRIPLDTVAGLDGVRLRFEFDSVNGNLNNFEGVYIDDVVIGFAERGEMVTNAGINTGFTAAPGGAGSNINSGDYQLEIRRGEEFGTAQPANPNTLQLTRMFDTNDRLTRQTTVTMPAGATIVEGQVFIVGDGISQLTFEFDSDGMVSGANVAVPYTPTSGANEVAAAFRDKINSNAVQGVLQLQATSASGQATLNDVRNDGRVALHGRAAVGLGTALQQQDVVSFDDIGDSNLAREQGEVLIHSNFVTEARDFGIWSDAGARDPDGIGVALLGAPHAGPVRNLRNENQNPPGGLTAGVVIENNVISGDMIGGVHVSGDAPAYEMVTLRPAAYPNQFLENFTAGDSVCDGDFFIVNSYRLSVAFEFEDIAGSSVFDANRVCPIGSGVAGGDGWTATRIPILYRRSITNVPGFTQIQMANAINTAFNGSILANNATTLFANSFVAGSRLRGGISGPDPAIYFNHVSQIIDGQPGAPRGKGYAFARIVPISRGPQPFAQVVNNTIYGNDGLASFSPEANIDTAASPNDTLTQAINTQQGRQNYPQAYNTAAAIGDGPFFRTDASVDVDFYQFQMIAGDRVQIDVDATSALDGLLRLFDATGTEIAFSDNNAAPGEPAGVDPYIDFIPTVSGTYYVAVSGLGNRAYDPLSLGSRAGNASTGSYNLTLGVRSPRNWYVNVDAIYAAGANFTVSNLFNTAPVNVAGVGMPPGPPQFAQNLANAINATGIANAQVVGRNWVLISGATNVTGLGGVVPGPAETRHHVTRQEGIFLSEQASPTMLNNVLVNHENGLFQSQNSTTEGPGGVAISPFTAIEAASVYQFNHLGNSTITGGGNDFNVAVANNVQLFVNAPGGNFYPAVNSPLIDSAVDTLQDRDIFLNTVKAPMGLPASPILAPARDALGQLRIDDPNYDSPLAQGADVFKDRGGLDRADFVSPRAVLVNPKDNDSLGIDIDPSETYVQLASGSYSEFTILIRDGFTADNPFPGALVVDSTLQTAPKLDVEGDRTLSLNGPAVTVFQDGQLLLEGFDYRYRYDSIGNTIQIISLAGAWPNDSVFEVKLNNRDRYVIDAPSGSVLDGDVFTITDATGARITFEYDSGYRLQVGPTLAFQVPLAGAGANGINDGQKFTINDGKKVAVFEFDNNATLGAGTRRVAFANGDTRDQLAQSIVDAINLAVTQGALDGLQPRNLGAGLVHVGATPSTSTSVTSSSLTANVAQYPTGLIVPAAGIGLGGIVEGETFRITNGPFTRTFEFDSDGMVTGTNIAVTFLATSTVDDLANTIALAINSTGLGLGAGNIGNGVVRFTTPTPAHTVDVSLTMLTRTMFIGGVNDGETFSITKTGDLPIGFEFQKDAVFVDADNDLVPDNTLIAVVASDTQDDIANKIVAAIEAQASFLDSVHFADGNIQVDDTTDGSPFLAYSMDVTGSPTLTLTGLPGVRPATTLQLPVSVALLVPATGGATIQDGEKFTVTNLGTTLVFEFDSDGNFEDLDNDFIPDNQIVPFLALDTQGIVANTLATVLGGAGLGLTPVNFGSGIVSLGGGTTAVVDLDYLGLGSSLGQNIYLRGLNDGDWFAIDDGTRSQTFEYENSIIGNGVVAGRTPIFFTPIDLADDVANSTAAVLQASNLCTIDGTTCLDGAANLGNGQVLLGDSGRHITTLRPVTALSLIGVPAGSVTVPFQPDPSFSDVEMAGFLLDSVNLATAVGKLTNVVSSYRGGSTVFVDFQTATGGKVDFTLSTASVAGVNNFYLQAIQDLAGNELRTNRSSGQTQFTILMPGVVLDYSDSPDPFSGPGRYPTDSASDGARHSIGRNVDGSLKAPILGVWIDREFDGQLASPAQGDDVDLAVNLTSSPGLSLSGAPGNFTIVVGDAGFGVANVADAQTFTIFDGTVTATIEFDSNLDVTDGRTVVKFVAGDSIADLGTRIAAAINRTGLSVRATDLGSGQVQVYTNDDDGVSFGGLFNEYLDTPITVTVIVPSGWDGKQFLDGWIDYNQDGDWEDPGEQVFVGTPVEAGANQLTVRALAGATPGQTFARFRLSTTGQLLPTGLAVGGEVEDYAIQIIPGIPPVAIDDPTTANIPLYTTTEDTAIGISAVEGLIANDSDANGDPMSVAEVNGSAINVGNLLTLPSGATVLVQADGSFSYDPTTSALLNSLALGATTTDTFTYRLTDGVLPSNVATVTITVTGLNDAPAAANDNYATTEDAVKAGVNLMTDDTGAGVDTDADQGPFPGTVSTLRLIGVNGVTLNGTSNVIVTIGSGAQVTALFNATTGLFDGAFAYDPRLSASLQALAQGGAPALDVFTYRIADSLGATSDGTVTMTVTGVNDAPIATTNNYATDEDTTLSGVNMILNNTGAGADSDPDTGETATLALTRINGAAITVNLPIVLPSGSTVTPLGTNGNFSYQPGPAYNALLPGQTQNDSFTYTIVDIHGAAAVGTVTVTVGGVNDAPTARSNNYGTDENTPLTGRNMITNNTGTGVDSDPDTGDVLKVSQILKVGTVPPEVPEVPLSGTSNVVITLPSGATLTMIYNSGLGRFDGAFVYDASTSPTLNALNVGATALDTFGYTIEDLAGTTSTSTVTITVAGANDPPTARPNSYVTTEDASLGTSPVVNVITDAPADTDPDTGDTALLNVIAVNGVSGNVGQNITTGKGAMLKILANGAMTYDPTNSATLQALVVAGSATDTFTYTISDNRGGTSTATVTVTVTGLNDAPIARPNSYTTDDNTALAGKNVITDATADSDPDTGETALLVVSQVNGSGAGVGAVVLSAKGANVLVDANGALVYDPTVSATLNALTVGQSDTDTFNYTIRDPAGLTSTATVTVTVVGVNDAPVARNNNYSVSENASLTGQNIITDAPADTDADTGDTLRITAINGVSASVGTMLTTAQGATLLVTSSGVMTYNPTGSAQLNALTTGQTATETFIYTLSDNRNATATATVTITVQGVNDAPTVNNDSVTLNQDTVATINILANDSDPEGPLSTSTVTILAGGPSHGTAVVNVDRSVTYTPTLGYTGPDSFQYQLTDNQGATSATATVSITVRPTPSPFQNPANALDVNADGFVSPIDALLVINFLNENPQSNPTPPAPPPYLDVDGDRVVAPNDALQVVNFLNLPGNSEGGGEGEGPDSGSFTALAWLGAAPQVDGQSDIVADHRWAVQAVDSLPPNRSLSGSRLADWVLASDDDVMDVEEWGADWLDDVRDDGAVASDIWAEWGAES